MVEVIQVAVGCAANGEDLESQQVLEYTLRKHSSQSVAIAWMKLSKDPKNFFYSDGKKGWQTKLWSTPFSGFRWAVPALFNFTGKAIYMDSDCVVQADIAELWNQKFAPGKVVLAKGGEQSWRFCVSLWDCAAAKRHMLPIEQLRANPLSHRNMIAHFKRRAGALMQPFEGNWNCIDGEDYADLADPAIKCIHYSSEAHQPHHKYALPRLAAAGEKHWFDGETKPHWRPDMQALFDRLLGEAEANHFKASQYLPKKLFGPYQIASHENYKGHQWVK